VNKKSLLSAFLAAILIGGLVLASAMRFGTVQASTGASGIPKPSVPEFNVKFVNASYNVTTTNPYTGVNEVQQISNNSIEVTIKNQPFGYSNNQIYYNIRTKPHFADNWNEVYPLRNITSSYNGDGTFSYAQYINDDSTSQSKSSYTIIAFPVVATELYSASGYDIQRYYSGEEGTSGRYFAFLSTIPSGGQIDFQVEALVGHASQRWVVEHPFYPTIGGHFAPAIAYDSTSGWSNTHSITIGESQTPTPSPATTPTPTTPTPSQEPPQTEQIEPIVSAAIAGAVIIAVLGLLIYLIKRK
jgi:hypothetical protein